jgi:superfamily II DNA or RNA helicase
MTYEIQLRDYQAECVENVLNEAKAGTSRQLVVLPTGSGKTIVMAAIARRLDKRTLILAHRQELIDQTLDKFKMFWPGCDVGICMGELDEVDNHIVVGSIQSCSRPKRLERLKAQGFELMMIDEAHHAPSASYQAVIDGLGFAGSNGNLLVGVTATPQHKLGLGNTFSKVVYSRSISTMIRAGYLAPLIGRKILTTLSLTDIRIQNGDFAIGDLSEAINTPQRNTFIAEKYKAYAGDRKGVAFCCDVKHCLDLAEAMRAQGIAAHAVFGDMPPEERKQILEDLKHGRIQMGVSCGVLCEGWDQSDIAAVVMARPTRSHGLYIQSVGRGLRLHPGKRDCLVLDFTDRANNLDSIMSLSSAIPDAAHIKEEREEVEEVEREEGDKTSKVEILEAVDREFDILGTARFIWIDLGSDEWSLQDDERHEIVMKPAGDGYVSTLYSPNGDAKEIVASPLPLAYCSGVSEDYARKHLKVAFADASASWLKETAIPTPGQRAFLEKQNAYTSGMTKSEAFLAIRKIIAVQNKQRRNGVETDESLTSNQKFFLEYRGIGTENLTKRQAQAMIGKIKMEESTVSKS